MPVLPNPQALVELGSEDWAAVWYLAYTKPRQEGTAAEQLARQGYETYLPLYKTWPKGSAKSTHLLPVTGASFEPMFPRYVFFKPASAAQSLSPARHTRGVCTLVSFGAGPAQVGEALVGAVRALEATRNTADAQALTPFQPGRAVRCKDEQLKALQGLVIATSAQRVTVLLEILGRPTTVQMQHHQLELV